MFTTSKRPLSLLQRNLNTDMQSARAAVAAATQEKNATLLELGDLQASLEQSQQEQVGKNGFIRTHTFTPTHTHVHTQTCTHTQTCAHTHKHTHTAGTPAQHHGEHASPGQSASCCRTARTVQDAGVLGPRLSAAANRCTGKSGAYGLPIAKNWPAPCVYIYVCIHMVYMCIHIRVYTYGEYTYYM